MSANIIGVLGQNLDEIEGIKSEIILKDYIPIHKGNYNIITGAGGVGKSQVALKMLVNFLQANPNEKAVAIFTEDTKAVVNERLEGICLRSSLTVDEVKGRTFFKTLDNNDGTTFVSKVNRENIINQEYMDKFILNAKFHKVGFVILDPLEAFHTGLNENDAEDMKFLVVEAFQRLGIATGSAVVVLHHTSKGDKSGARGSSVITNKGRVAYNLRKVMQLDKDLEIEVVKDGWEKSVLISTIKDNHFVARWCDAIANNKGKLDLPISGGINRDIPIVTEYISDNNSYMGEML